MAEYPSVIWFLVPILIIYTTIVLSFYARRIAIVRHMRAHSRLSEEMFWRIKKGSKMVAKLTGTPLLALFVVSLAQSFWSGQYFTSFVLIPISVLGAWLFTDGLGNAAGAIYAAFDPSYRVTKMQKK
jgi:hypothetical protein